MPRDLRENEAKLAQALDALVHQEKPKFRETAREFAVPERTLRRRYHGGKSLFSRAPNGRKLNTEQEAALKRFIETLDKAGIPPKPKQIEKSANSILASAQTDHTTQPPQVGEHWDYERVVTERAIQPEDIYNFDETGFQIGVGRDQWIITLEPRKKLFNGNVTNRESVTVVDARQMMLRWFDNITDEHLAITDTGYINDILAFQWAQKFEKWTAPRTEDAHEVLQEELDRMEAVRSAHHARYNIARRYTRITGIVGQDHVEKMKWKKVMRELKMHCKRAGIIVR
ncbi:hypothetical protein PENNAL_c0164G07715 [Penicillium nalgiovense]|uniref:HTH CENPB-type domain-containing protein n=1 Tax=Penicillium nalgiovense TaxID=60175 RepID=A0A1V6WXY1_PENNA|nr:hypothetical protein PENNAL_c0164G07715 [Penicillium nalgiovense]